MRKTCSKCTGTFISTQIFGEKNIHMSPHPHYSLNLAPCDIFLFTKLKSVLKETRFDDLEEIKANTTRVLKASTSSNFKLCLKAWERRLNKCVIWGGGTTVRVLKFSSCKIIKFDFLEKKSHYLIVIPRTNHRNTKLP